jgi:hypothetical protein
MGIGRCEKPRFIALKTGAIAHLGRLKNAYWVALRLFRRKKP